MRLVIEADMTEPVVDYLEKRYAGRDGFRAVILPVEAVVPRVETQPAGKDEDLQAETDSNRIYREELYQDIKAVSEGGRTFLLLVILSSCVAAIGLLRGDTAIIIGAMVIAPLLGPNMGMAFAATLGDIDLARRSIQTNAIGISVALFTAIFIGWFAAVDVRMPEIASMVNISYADIVLALASGAAGALSITTGISGSLIGVERH